MRTEQDRQLASVRADPAAYDTVRRHTEALAAPLGPEDQVVQSMPDCQPHQVAPGPHHLVLRGVRARRPIADHTAGSTRDFRYLFNSYYEAVGARDNLVRAVA